MAKTPGPQGHRNWTQYNAAQRQQASAAVLIQLPPTPDHTGRRGRPEIYGEPFGRLLLTVALVFRLSDRRLQGLFEGLLIAAGVREARVPSLGWISTMRQRIGRRALTGHAMRLRAVLAQGEGAVLAIDSTGLSIRGAHAWRATRPYGKEGARRRTFLKLSVVCDTRDQSIAAWHLGPESTSDPSVVPALLEALQPAGRHPDRPAPRVPVRGRLQRAASTTEMDLLDELLPLPSVARTAPFRAHQPVEDREARRARTEAELRARRRKRFAHLDPSTAAAPTPVVPPPPAIAAVLADGAYDTKGVWNALAAHDVERGVIRLSADAQAWTNATPGAGLREQVRVVRDRQVTITPGSPAWRQRIGYHQRSLVETVFSRLAAQCGNRLRARSLAGQAGEVTLRLELLNAQMAAMRSG